MALRNQKIFINEDVVVAIADDETFLIFCEAFSTIVAPKGEKQFGLAVKYNDKEGCTIMVHMEMISL